ncbi:nucleotidyl transferase AbiEii/AbiGii toxin family protein [Patescibacteria group bacterium]|nr:nucleotidyl transferase AbiEii/AbiGii toxin family protein [Patescibacteria group bacterium]MBU2036416.1 nucleotidyl transferase AbiEii/AbiGii toxin family protein [Patescibacteria group bacterium]
MLSLDQVKELSKQLKINDSVIVREYYQLIFLKELYEEKYSEHIFFKGGTAIRLIFRGSRFSEDLDFTVEGKPENFNIFVVKFFKKLEKLYDFSFKKRKTITGERYLLTTNSSTGDYKIFINLDFSFREKVLTPTRAIIKTSYPVIFTSFVNCLSKEEILAEKIRAIMTRDKGRDIYDLWFLLSQNIPIRSGLIRKKLEYYNLKNFNIGQLVTKISTINKEKFILDVRPFVPVNEREKLGELFDYIISFLKQALE